MRRAVIATAIVTLLFGPGHALIDCWKPASPEELLGPGSVVVRGTIENLEWLGFECRDDQLRLVSCEADIPAGEPRRYSYRAATVRLKAMKVLKGQVEDRLTFHYLGPSLGLGDCPFPDLAVGREVVAIVEPSKDKAISRDAIVPVEDPAFPEWITRLTDHLESADWLTNG